MARLEAMLANAELVTARQFAEAHEAASKPSELSNT
jgi:hypothetical protein